MITFTKIQYGDLPDQIQKAVISYDDKQVIIDDSKITSEQLTLFTEFMHQNGYN